MGKAALPRATTQIRRLGSISKLLSRDASAGPGAAAAVAAVKSSVSRARVDGTVVSLKAMAL
jgi:hypothetical protein